MIVTDRIKKMDKIYSELVELVIEETKERNDTGKFTQSVLSHYEKKQTISPKQLAVLIELLLKGNDS